MDVKLNAIQASIGTALSPGGMPRRSRVGLAKAIREAEDAEKAAAKALRDAQALAARLRQALAADEDDSSSYSDSDSEDDIAEPQKSPTNPPDLSPKDPQQDSQTPSASDPTLKRWQAPAEDPSFTEPSSESPPNSQTSESQKIFSELDSTEAQNNPIHQPGNPASDAPQNNQLTHPDVLEPSDTTNGPAPIDQSSMADSPKDAIPEPNQDSLVPLATKPSVTQDIFDALAEAELVQAAHSTDQSASEYDKEAVAMYEAIQRLRCRFEEIFDKNRKATWNEGQKRGTRIGVRAMINRRCEAIATGQRIKADYFESRRKPTIPDVGVVLVLDCSGSMSGDGIAALKQSVVLLLESFQISNIPCGILKFSTNPTVLLNLDEMRQDLTQEIKERLYNSLTPDGGTDEVKALKAVEDMLELSEYKPEKKLIIFVTDGDAGNGAKKAIYSLNERDPSVQIIGVGAGAGARNVGNVYPQSIFVEDINDLPDALADVIREQLDCK